MIVVLCWIGWGFAHRALLSSPVGNWESLSGTLGGSEILVFNRDGTGWSLERGQTEGRQDSDFTWTSRDGTLRLHWKGDAMDRIMPFSISSSGERMSIRGGNEKIYEFIRLEGDPPPRPTPSER